MIYTSVLCFLTGYAFLRVGEGRYSPAVNWFAAIVGACAMYGMIQIVSTMYNFLFGPQFTLLKVLSNL